MPKFQFSGGGGVLWSQNWKYSKCQEMPKFQFSVGGGGGVLWSQNWKYSKCQEMPKFQFWGRGVQFFLGGGLLWSQNWKYSSAKKCLNLNFLWGGGGGALWSEIPERGSLENLDTNFTVWGYCTQTCLCITDSLSHTYVETNKDLGK